MPKDRYMIFHVDKGGIPEVVIWKYYAFVPQSHLNGLRSTAKEALSLRDWQDEIVVLMQFDDEGEMHTLKEKLSDLINIR